jgi:thiamine-phosphate pyrophosphorylase
MQLFNRARHELGLPIVAIGGITLDNAPLAISAGADSVAVINALFKTDNIQQTAQKFTQLFDKTHE